MEKRIDRQQLTYWTDKEMRMEASHLLDLCDQALNYGQAIHTPFLSQALRGWLDGILRREKLAVRSASGFPEYERTRYIIGGDELALEKTQDKVKVLAVEAVDSRARLEHRQLLGSLLGLGIKRDVIGDIRPGAIGFYVAVADEIEEYLFREWREAGREKIRVRKIAGEPQLLGEDGQEKRITSASSRLDAVLAGGFNLSRSLCQELIAQGKIKRNDLVLLKPDAVVKEGDVLSCRGYGRIRLLEAKETKKGRLGWNIMLYQSRKH